MGPSQRKALVEAGAAAVTIRRDANAGDIRMWLKVIGVRRILDY